MKAEALFETVTNELIAAIEAGAGEWQMPWRTLAVVGIPTNPDGRAYRGMNALWLPMVAATRGWDAGLWGTYRGWQRHDAQVRRGEKGTAVVLWKVIDQGDANDEPDRRGSPRPRLVARTFTVFAVEQTEGAEALVARRERPEPDRPERIAEADAYFAAVGATVAVGGIVACYEPATDTIRVPRLEQFPQPAHYYSTLAHEHVHWTGRADRLDRDLTGRFGSDAYAVEELIAELGAAIWSAQAGISTATRQDHAAYLDHWLRILRQDTRALVTVASRAQAAVDHLNGCAEASAPGVHG